GVGEEDGERPTDAGGRLRRDAQTDGQPDDDQDDDDEDDEKPEAASTPPLRRRCYCHLRTGNLSSPNGILDPLTWACVPPSPVPVCRDVRHLGDSVPLHPRRGPRDVAGGPRLLADAPRGGDPAADRPRS